MPITTKAFGCLEREDSRYTFFLHVLFTAVINVRNAKTSVLVSDSLCGVDCLPGIFTDTF